MEIAKMAPGQSVTLEFGDAEVILTKLDGIRHFTLEDWYGEEREVYLVEDVIREDALLHYSFEFLGDDPEVILRQDQGKFGKDRKILDFLARPVDSIEMEDEDEEDDEEDDEEG
ncbi:MAG: hypothetical protein H7837_03700 [Magnetococcus sp. MYC-9]